jgi:hypothetical protein
MDNYYNLCFLLTIVQILLKLLNKMLKSLFLLFEHEQTLFYLHKIV